MIKKIIKSTYKTALFTAEQSSFVTLKRLQKIFCLSFFLILIISLESCSNTQTGPLQEVIMDTVCSVNAYDSGSKKLYAEIAARLHTIDTEFNKTNSQSQISYINKNAGESPVAVNRDVLYVVKEALYFAKITKGAFDPTIGPVVDLWGINTDHAHIPDTADLSNALQLVNWHNILINGKNEASEFQPIKNYPSNTVFPDHITNAVGFISLTIKGMELDLGGIVKGFAADEITKILSKYNVKYAIINLGGNIFAYGTKPDNELWHIGIKDPNNPEKDPLLVLPVKSSTIVTSGIYERYFIKNGKRYHHIIDPKTGYPVDNEIASSTIICNSSITADALSTAVFVLGQKKGFQLIQKLSNLEKNKQLPVFDKKFQKRYAAYTGIDVIYIQKDGKITNSKKINQYQ